jgi:O-ureido-D-serine cyclo-ligase
MSGDRVALVTAAQVRKVDHDLPPLVAALADVGLDGVPTVWDDPTVDWSGFAAAVVRSTWDYVPRRDRFLAWAEEVDAVTRLWNPPAVLRWNTDKRYLFELAAAGAAIVPTRLLEPGDPVALPELAGAGAEIVVKPSVSAGSQDTDRYRADRTAEAVAHVRRLLDAGRNVFVQPYLPSVDESGERALVYLEGHFSHAALKGPLLVPDTAVVAGLFAQEQMQPATPTATERALGDQVMDLVAERFGRLLYGRVDVVDGPDGPCVLELELAEPSLFHAHGPGSAARLAEAIVARLGDA